MRAIPPALAAKVDDGATTLAHVITLRRRDGAVAAFTDHDRVLIFDGHICTPNTGLSVGAIEKGLGLNADSASLKGALASEAITESDIARGLWDGARADIYRVDWGDPSLSVHVFAGRIGEVRRGEQAFEAELRGLQAGLNHAAGRVFSRFCDADAGDVRCGVDIGAALYRAAGHVLSVEQGNAIRVSGLGGFEAGWFARGRLRWSAGGETEVVSHTRAAASDVLELRDALAPALGAAFDVFAGCDKRLETCRAKFANALNFRGFPHMPGNDAVQSGPNTNEPMDGGSRWR